MKKIDKFQFVGLSRFFLIYISNNTIKRAGDDSVLFL